MQSAAQERLDQIGLRKYPLVTDHMTRSASPKTPQAAISAARPCRIGPSPPLKLLCAPIIIFDVRDLNQQLERRTSTAGQRKYNLRRRLPTGVCLLIYRFISFFLPLPDPVLAKERLRQPNMSTFEPVVSSPFPNPMVFLPRAATDGNSLEDHTRRM